MNYIKMPKEYRNMNVYQRDKFEYFYLRPEENKQYYYMTGEKDYDVGIYSINHDTGWETIGGKTYKDIFADTLFESEGDLKYCMETKFYNRWNKGTLD